MEGYKSQLYLVVQCLQVRSQIRGCYRSDARNSKYCKPGELQVPAFYGGTVFASVQSTQGINYVIDQKQATIIISSLGWATSLSMLW